MYMFAANPSISRIAIQTQTENEFVDEGTSVDILCSIERVYPRENLKFAIESADGTQLTSEESANWARPFNSDGTYHLQKMFSVILNRSHHEKELRCQVFYNHRNGFQQEYGAGLYTRHAQPSALQHGSEL